METWWVEQSVATREKGMNYNALEEKYWTEQVARVESLRRRIVSRAEVAPGVTIPDDDDLVIGTGRVLSATILFVDISGFSRRPCATPRDQELMLRVLNLYFTQMVRLVEDYSGHVEKNTGDGLMAYFVDDVRRGATSTHVAMACALTMDAVNRHLISPVMRATGIDPIAYRTSMDAGSVTIARMGAPRRFNAITAIGNVANFAASILKLIEPGEIALGASAQASLPEEWRRWTEWSPRPTGWTYMGAATPYPMYLYRGRWARLV